MPERQLAFSPPRLPEKQKKSAKKNKPGCRFGLRWTDRSKPERDMNMAPAKVDITHWTLFSLAIEKPTLESPGRVVQGRQPKPELEL
jgi:hypothetical protein